MTEQNLSIYLCGSIYREEGRCEHLLYCEKEGQTYEGKTLQKYSIYCTAEGKCKKIKEASMWTGCSPKWCKKRRERGI